MSALPPQLHPDVDLKGHIWQGGSCHHHYATLLHRLGVDQVTTSFHLLQVIEHLVDEDDGATGWSLFAQWGKVGSPENRISGAKLTQYPTADAARAEFERVFEEKTGNLWVSNHIDEPSNFQRQFHKFVPSEVEAWERTALSKEEKKVAKAVSGPQRVVCYGDSLTEGYTLDPMGRVHFTPYSDMLSGVSNGRLLGIGGHGVSGQLTKGILRRLEDDLFAGDGEEAGDNLGGSRDGSSSECSDDDGDEKEGKKQASVLPNDVVIILGGSNDVAHMYDPDHILGNLIEMVDTILEKVPSPGPKMIVLCTVPPLAGNRETDPRVQDTVTKLRTKLNKGIESMVRTYQGSTPNTSFRLCDLFQILSADTLVAPGKSTATVRAIPLGFAADHIHFNEAGYRHMAHNLADLILKD